MDDSCVLMFSGGRDSTLAAVRLANSGKKLILSTVSSEHLEGISAVEQRLIELKRYLSEDTLWILYADTGLTAPGLNLAPNTCLPCFLKYTSLGVITARKFNTPSLSFGFTKYQSEWPEQTRYAVEKFRTVLNEFSINLEIPVYNITTKEKAIEELEGLGLTISALEQKCSRQIMNKEISLALLEKAIDEWTTALHLAVSSNLLLDPALISSRKLSDIKPPNRKKKVGQIGKHNK